MELALRPSVNFRPQESPVDEPLGAPYEFRSVDDNFEIALKDGLVPPLRMQLHAPGATFTLKGMQIDNILYPVEERRGYRAHGALWSPGFFKMSLEPREPVTLVASTEAFETMRLLDPATALRAERGRRSRLLAFAPPMAREGVAAELVLAADQFIVTPSGRTFEATRARAYGDEVRTVIAGYHWFTDWGRDTMISLEGLTLATGRYQEAGYILRTFGHYVRDGLIPNMFPEGENQGLYHTADATLWFFHAIQRYVQCSGDRLTLGILYPRLKDIVDSHLKGTRFGIHVDPQDGLLVQGAPGYQLTWMDAKVDDWVVTPRRGKAVEINALWYNALRLMAAWADDQGDDAARYRALAEQVKRSFNQRFWYEAGGYLYDVVDGEGGGSDTKCRPNQLFAISLPHPVLDRGRWAPVMQVVHDRLLTTSGLRTLEPGDPDYKARYFGDLRARDAAYHQGTIWAWLIGPYVDAWLKVFPDDTAGASRAVEGCLTHLDDGCIGSISEIFDADPPFNPRGCIAQAWSIAEVLRSWLKLEQKKRRDSTAVSDGTRLAKLHHEETFMAKDNDQVENKILGDIDPNPGTEDFVPSDGEGVGSEDDEGAMSGGSQDNPGTRSGSRDITGSPRGGSETGGVRNMRKGSGHSGGDIGNRPEVKKAEW